VNALGEPVRDKEGQPVMEEYDARDPRDYFGFVLATPENIQEGALKGLSLYEVDLRPSDLGEGIPEPLVHVYARDKEHAVEVFMREMGITKILHKSQAKATKLQ
jgi:hypothetical protein